MSRQAASVTDRDTRSALLDYASKHGVAAALALLVDAATESDAAKTIRAYVRVDGLAAGLRLITDAVNGEGPLHPGRASRRSS